MPDSFLSNPLSSAEHQLAQRAADAMAFANRYGLGGVTAQQLAVRYGWARRTAAAVLRHLEVSGSLRRAGRSWITTGGDRTGETSIGIASELRQRRQRVDEILAAEDRASNAIGPRTLADADDTTKRDFWSRRFEATRRRS